MTVYEINLSNTPNDYSFNITLEAKKYNMRVSYNVRDERWILNIYDINNNFILSTPLVVNYDLTTRFKLESLPANPLVLVNLSGNEECSKDQIGSTCVLLVDY